MGDNRRGRWGWLSGSHHYVFAGDEGKLSLLGVVLRNVTGDAGSGVGGLVVVGHCGSNNDGGRE